MKTRRDRERRGRGDTETITRSPVTPSPSLPVFIPHPLALANYSELAKTAHSTEVINAMRYMTATLLLASMIVLACYVTSSRSVSANALSSGTNFQEREEINQKYELAPGSRVEISSIRGPVEVYNTNSATAELQIIRTARTRADLEYHKIEVQQTANGLVIRGIQEPNHRGQNVRVNHHVILRVPRRIDLAITSISGGVQVEDIVGQTTLNSISGSATIGNVAGPLSIHSISGSLSAQSAGAQAVINSISGSATIGNVGGPLDVRSISGNLQVGDVRGEARVNSVSGDAHIGLVSGSLTVLSVSGNVKTALSNLGTPGIRINSVSGSVEIALTDDVNADFNAESISGQVYLNVPNVIRDAEVKSPNVRARIGAGGTPIKVFSVSGNVRLTRS